MPDFNHIERINTLITKYCLGEELNEREQVDFQEWVNSSATNSAFLKRLQDDEQMLRDLTVYTSWIRNNREVVREKVWAKYHSKQRVVKFSFFKIAFAASLLVVAGVLTLWMVVRQRSDKKSLPTASIIDTSQRGTTPGFKAKLTLSDGSTIELNKSSNGEVTKQGSIAVLNKDGSLVYNNTAGSNGKGSGTGYNTLTTSGGETYSLTLSDGSQLSLNAGSSIRYPVVFDGTTRRVEITGEVFFKVAHNASRPFIVTAGSTEVQVLGTTFNVNAYKDEDAIKTTLITGKVKILSHVNNHDESAILKPGQQAQVSGQNIKLIPDIDVDQAVAWRRGVFQFNNDNIKTIMRQIARWYNMSVEYQGQVSDHEFWGTISRDLSVSEVLTILANNGQLHFKIEGNKIIVMP